MEGEALVTLGAVVTRVRAVTDLDQDPCAVIATGDWVRIDNGKVEVGPAPRPGCRAKTEGAKVHPGFPDAGA